MKNMVCFECVLKHLAAGLSYGKEVISGHSKGNELDHRADFLGLIINAEQHLQLIDSYLFRELTSFRKAIQAKKVILTTEDLDFIRNFYLKVLMKSENNIDISKTEFKVLENPDIIYIDVNNIDQFDLSYKLLKKNLIGYNKIYVIKPTVDLSAYIDIIVINKSLNNFLTEKQTTSDIIITYQNTGVLKLFDAKYLMPTVQNIELKIDLLNEYSPIYNYDHIKLQPVNVEKFLNTYIETNYPITNYFYKSLQQTNILNLFVTVEVDRPVCCGTKNDLNTKLFVLWNDAGFKSLKLFLNI